MNQTSALIFCVFVIAACDDSEPSSTRGNPDGGTYLNDSGVECCPPSPQPGCCMDYGGAKKHHDACNKTCDGMPNPNDPAWRLVQDEFGCPTWTSKGATGPCCGSPLPPADASTPPIHMCYGDPISLPN